jgi:hypothetical protein
MTRRTHPVASRAAARAAFAAALACLAAGAACGTPDVAARGGGGFMTRVDPALRDDPAVQAANEEVEAAIARERGEVPADELQLRVQNEWENGSRQRYVARMPVPNPSELSARREVRRTETETALSRLDETVLLRRVERCFLSVESLAQQERRRAYEQYAARQQTLLERSRARRESGAVSEAFAARFEIETQIRLATRDPGPAFEVAPLPDALPAVSRVERRLALDPGRVRETVQRAHPGVAVHERAAEQYRALSERARVEARPWIDFVDFSYGPDSSARTDEEVRAQVALRIPFGAEAGADVARYRALGRSEERAERVLLDEQVRRGRIALLELDHFESQAERWSGLLDLGGQTETLAESWDAEGIVTPSDVAQLYDQAHAARLAVLEARERAGNARCALLGTTGVALEEWPRG